MEWIVIIVNVLLFLAEPFNNSKLSSWAKSYIITVNLYSDTKLNKIYFWSKTTKDFILQLHVYVKSIIDSDGNI